MRAAGGILETEREWVMLGFRRCWMGGFLVAAISSERYVFQPRSLTGLVTAIPSIRSATVALSVVIIILSTLISVTADMPVRISDHVFRAIQPLRTPLRGSGTHGLIDAPV